MKKRINSLQRSRTVRLKKPAARANVALRALGFIFLLCLFGCLWVCKENWNERLSCHMLTLEEKQRELKEQKGILQADLCEMSQITCIEDLARNHLGMHPPRVPPDTIWCSEAHAPALMGTMIFYGFNSKGK